MNAMLRTRGGIGCRLLDTPAGDWRDRALCAGADPELFHPGPGEDGTAAKAICQDCPVTAACLDWAHETGDDWAILGGTTAKERRTRRHHAPRPIRQRQCNRCGTPFWTERSRYCSAACREEAARAARAGAGAARKQPDLDRHLDTIRAMATAGHGDGDIAAATGLTRGQVQYLRSREGIRAPIPCGWPKKTRQETSA